jgi:hypothetical protein
MENENKIEVLPTDNSSLERRPRAQPALPDLLAHPSQTPLDHPDSLLCRFCTRGGLDTPAEDELPR